MACGDHPDHRIHALYVDGPAGTRNRPRPNRKATILPIPRGNRVARVRKRVHNWRRKAALALAVATVSGCHSPPSLGLPPLGRDSNPPAAAAPQVSGAIAAGMQPTTVFEARGTPAASNPATPSAGRSSQPGDVTLNFVDTDIREVARVILGTTLKLTYTIDPAIKGTATLDTGTPLARDQLLPTLETLLNQNGATLVQRNGLYAVVPIATAGATNAITGAGVAGGGSQVVMLHFASAKDLAKVLEPYVGAGGKLAADPSHNALVISGDMAARETLIGLIHAFDTDLLAGQSFAIFPTGDSDPVKEAEALEKALHAESDGSTVALVRVVPLPHVNAVLVASAQPRYLDTAKRLFRLTKTVEGATARTWHVYYVQNGQSGDLENLLQRAFTPNHVSPTPGPGTTAPGTQQASMTGSGGFQAGALGNSSTTGTSGSTAGTAGSAGNQQSSSPGGLGSGGLGTGASTPAVSSPATEALSAEGGANGDNENRLRIIANRRNNALLIYATHSEYAAIAGMLRKIDIVPLEVLIDATIAEVDLTGQLQYGTQFFFKVDHIAETLGTTPSFPPTALQPSGLVGFALSHSPNFILQALADASKVKVLSAPQLLVMGDEPARLQVGQQVPVLTGTATSTLTSTASTVNSIDYHATGVIMQVTPHIDATGLVTLEVGQEVSDVANPAANTTTGSPTFDDRVVQTRIAVRDGQTVALAGLIRDSSSADNNGIPFLKDVPVISTLLSSQSNSRTRTELLVLITPHIVHDQRDARALTEDLRNQLMNAGMVPAELQRTGLPGHANPNGL
jgi:general secretion pathway protein D